MATKNTDEILKDAQQFYVNKDYESALDMIRTGKNQLDPALFHYNLGSIYLKKGDLGPARFHLEKAKDVGFSYPMLWKNLEYIKSQTYVTDPTKSEKWDEYLIGKTLDFPQEGFVLIFLIGLSTLLLLVRKKVLKSKALAVVLALLFLSPLVAQAFFQRGYSYAIALKDLRVYEGPSKIYADYGSVGAGSRIVVGRFYQDWYYVLSPSELAGWVEKSYLGFY